MVVVVQCGWYWGALSFDDAEERLSDHVDGSFLVRDSSDDRYILSLSFRSESTTHHTRIEHYKGARSYSVPYSLTHRLYFVCGCGHASLSVAPLRTQPVTQLAGIDSVDGKLYSKQREACNGFSQVHKTTFIRCCYVHLIDHLHSQIKSNQIYLVQIQTDRSTVSIGTFLNAYGDLTGHG